MCPLLFIITKCHISKPHKQPKEAFTYSPKHYCLYHYHLFFDWAAGWGWGCNLHQCHVTKGAQRDWPLLVGLGLKSLALHLEPWISPPEFGDSNLSLFKFKQLENAFSEFVRLEFWILKLWTLKTTKAMKSLHDIFSSCTHTRWFNVRR